MGEINLLLLLLLLDESREQNDKLEKRKPMKTPLVQFRLFIFYEPACLRKKFHGRILSIWVFSVDRHYLNNRVFMSRNYRLIVTPQKFDVLKTNICPRSEASRANMLDFKNIKFPRGNYQTDSSETKTLYCLYCSPLNFLPHASSKIN